MYCIPHSLISRIVPPNFVECALYVPYWLTHFFMSFSPVAFQNWFSDEQRNLCESHQNDENSNSLNTPWYLFIFLTNTNKSVACLDEVNEKKPKINKMFDSLAAKWTIGIFGHHSRSIKTIPAKLINETLKMWIPSRRSSF